MLSNNKKLIAVFGATGRQGGGVVRALQASGQFKVRALSRNPGKHRDLGDEVVKADLDRSETLNAAFEGVHGVFLVTNFWEQGTDELSRQPRRYALPRMPVSNTVVPHLICRQGMRQAICRKHSEICPNHHGEERSWTL